jgi:predicted N-formylglutamate amidohydrolase
LSEYVQAVNPGASSSVVLVCEHATSFIPASFENLGLSIAASESHVAWDPGALAVAQRMSEKLDAVLIAATASRLVYDCNRPPGSPDAMPARSEIFEIPGNIGLGDTDRAERAKVYYLPFRAELAARIARTPDPIIVTIHSFTPVYHGHVRSVEIGVLHDSDARLGDAMLICAADHTRANVQRNQPYGPQHGVTHTLKEHAISVGHLNVMLEVRNDLIATDVQQVAMADMLATWVADAFARTNTKGAVKCTA